MAHLYLALAICCEVVGTLVLKATNGFTVLLPSAVVAVGYALSFYLLSLAVKTIPVAVAYAIWSGLGLVLTTLGGWIFWRQVPDIAALAGMTLILAGILVMQVFSRSL